MIALSTKLILLVSCVTQLLTGGEALSFEECRSPRRTGGQRFSLDECPTGQLINIRSAELGFNTRWDPKNRRSRCSQRDVACKRSTQHPDIMRCNGQRTCSFGPNVLMYPQGNAQKLCSRHRDANFISIRYQCIHGATTSRDSGTMMSMKMMMTQPASAAGTNYSTVVEPLPTSTQESPHRFNIRTLSMGEIVGMIVVAGILLLALVAFLIVIVIYLCRHRREKPNPTKAAAAASTEQHQYRNGDVEHATGHAATSENEYQGLQRHYLHLPQLRNAIAAYCELTST